MDGDPNLSQGVDRIIPLRFVALLAKFMDLVLRPYFIEGNSNLEGPGITD